MTIKTRTSQPSCQNFHSREDHYYDGTIVKNVQQPLIQASVQTSSISGEDLPSWRELIALGENATTDMNAVERRVSFRPASFHMLIDCPVNRVKFVYDSIYVPVAPTALAFADATRANNQAAAKFYRNANKVLRSLQGAVFLGEALEALHMIRHPAQALRKGIDDFISLAKKRAKGIRLPSGSLKRKTKLRQVVGDTYLEFAFGWRPLLSDTVDGMVALTRLSEIQAPFEHVHGIGTDTQVLPATDPVISFVNVFNQKSREYTHSVQPVVVKYYGVVKVADDYGKPPPARMLGLTLPDVPVAAWELFPWSFLIDYFTNVGDMIEAWSFPSGSLRWVSKTTVRESFNWTTAHSEQEHQTGIEAAFGLGASIQAFSPGSCTTETYRKEVTRIRAAAFPNVSFQWELPGMNLKWLNIAALISARKSPPT